MLRRPLVLAVLAAVAIGLCWVVVLEIRGNEDSYKLAAMRRYWTSRVEREVTIGETRADVAQWARSVAPGAKGVSPPLVQGPSIVVAPDRLKVTGFDFVCSVFLVQVVIDFGPDDRVTRRSVSTPGVCV